MSSAFRSSKRGRTCFAAWRRSVHHSQPTSACQRCTFHIPPSGTANPGGRFFSGSEFKLDHLLRPPSPRRPPAALFKTMVLKGTPQEGPHQPAKFRPNLFSSTPLQKTRCCCCCCTGEVREGDTCPWGFGRVACSAACCEARYCICGDDRRSCTVKRANKSLMFYQVFTLDKLRILL